MTQNNLYSWCQEASELRRNILTSLEETVPVSTATPLPRSFYYEINNLLLSFVFNFYSNLSAYERELRKFYNFFPNPT